MVSKELFEKIENFDLIYKTENFYLGIQKFIFHDEHLSNNPLQKSTQKENTLEYYEKVFHLKVS